MCGCAEALVRAVVAFFDAFLVDCFLFWFRRPRPRPDNPASAHRDPLVPKDWTGEVLPASDKEKGFAESTLSNQQLADGNDTNEELRREPILLSRTLLQLIHYLVLLVLISLVVLLVLGALFVIPRSNIKGNMVNLVQASLAILFEAVFSRTTCSGRTSRARSRRTRRRSPVTSSSSAWLAPLADPSLAPTNLLLSLASSISRCCVFWKMEEEENLFILNYFFCIMFVVHMI
ncbi:uncharacterized protein [Triticum aestivum]|uniref:uncharacterized protein isoform X2 n=1 Tax=Triticum aestivum TaxID=4565 RepID=UPI00084294AC|nr:uncharacterized protein LOC123080723 isoform X2 [Triticum aestivum]